MQAKEFLAKALDFTDPTLAHTMYVRALGLDDDNPEKPGGLIFVGDIFYDRYEAGRISDDLDKAISCYDRSVQLTPDFDPDQAPRLFDLGTFLITRFENNGDVTDIDKACFCFESTLLIHPAGPNTCSTMSSLGGVLIRRFERMGDSNDLDRAISVLQQAIDILPDHNSELDKPNCLNKLAIALRLRFKRFDDIPDLEQSIVYQRQAADLTPEGHSQKITNLCNLGNAVNLRFERLGDISDLEESIATYRMAVDFTPNGDPSKPACLTNFGTALRLKYDRLEDPSALEESIVAHRMALELTPNGHADKPSRLIKLGLALKSRFDSFEKISDLEESIVVQRRAVQLTPDGHAGKASYLDKLGIALEARFTALEDVADLRASIAAHRMAVELTVDGHPEKASYLLRLGSACMSQVLCPGASISELGLACDALAAAAESKVGVPRVRFNAARAWGTASEVIMNDPQQALRAYGCAVDLISQVAWMGLAIEGQHYQLDDIGELVRTAAAAAARYGECDLALEWLEHGRSVVWGQILRRRSPVDLLRDHDPVRANRLEAISRDLEANSQGAGQSAEERGQQLRVLVAEWDKLVSEVRKSKGFEDFLGMKRISNLLSAASIGPVVVLNVHEEGCDALVLMADADGVIHIPLELNSQRAQVLLDSLHTIESRQSLARYVDSADRGFRIVGQDNHDPDREFRTLLAELWNRIVKPILDSLAFSVPDSEDDDLPRLFWCPTGSLAFLPIHAAGLYDTDEPGTKVFDFIVSSYTPNVSALLKAPRSPPECLRILAVSQAATEGQSALPNTTREIGLLRQRAIGGAVELIVAADEAGTVKHVLEEMDKCHWIHLACHGTQDLENPIKSAFLLADGNLEFDEIIKHPLPHAEFAFLSACQTATGHAELADEAVHLAAGMLLAGYRGVIATMWSIMDNDGPVVADAVYAEILKDGKADSLRAAHALHRAVQKLRSSKAPFLAWIPFIHMGL